MHRETPCNAVRSPDFERLGGVGHDGQEFVIVHPLQSRPAKGRDALLRPFRHAREGVAEHLTRIIHKSANCRQCPLRRLPGPHDIHDRCRERVFGGGIPIGIRTLGYDKQIRQHQGVIKFGRCFEADHVQRIEAVASLRMDGIQPEHGPEGCPVVRSAGFILPLGIGADHRAGMVKKVWNNNPDALSTPHGGCDQYRTVTIEPEKSPPRLADNQPLVAESTGANKFAEACPFGRAESGWPFPECPADEADKPDSGLVKRPDNERDQPVEEVQHIHSSRFTRHGVALKPDARCCGKND